VSSPLPLEGIRVLDLGTVVAGPGAAARLGDFGADVIKVERPQGGDTTRSLGWSVDGVTLWWKWIGRNKRPVTLNLGDRRGQDLLLRLVADADVLVESFRPGTLERWDLAPGRLLKRNSRLVILRVSGFGQTGPYRERPGFGTLAESISGFAHMSGFPDGPPVLPGAFAVMVALYRRDAGAGGGAGGGGQVIDLSLFESLFQMLGPLPAVHHELGVVPGRIGNAIAYAAPRGAYPTKDGRWIGVSGTSQAVAERVLAAIGRPELAADPRFATNAARVEHREELDALIEGWTREHTLGEALAEFERRQAAAAPVYDMAQIFADPHFRARGTIALIPDDDLGEIAMAEVEPRLSETPGRIRHPGRALGAANAGVYKELGLSEPDLEELRDQGVI
jgi:crotonobetainyl-CoA:carnitine CoA-transferase CaiB-like acyl-CoA transferase